MTEDQMKAPESPVEAQAVVSEEKASNQKNKAAAAASALNGKKKEEAKAGPLAPIPQMKEKLGKKLQQQKPHNFNKALHSEELKAAKKYAKMPKNDLPGFTGELWSRLDHAVTISYNGEAMVLPPRAKKQRIPNIKKLGALPSGITLIKHSSQK
jgi:hypothetical protein